MKQVLLNLGMSVSCFSSPMDNAKQDGEQVASLSSHDVKDLFKNFNADDFLPLEVKGQEFDDKQAKSNVDKGITPPTEAGEFLLSSEVQQNIASNKHVHENEDFINRSDSITDSSLETLNAKEIVAQVPGESTTHICREAGDLYTITYDRILDVEVTHIPETRITLTTCLGHLKNKTYYWKSDAEAKEKEKTKEFKNDPHIKSYSVNIISGSWKNDYKVEYSWTHKDNFSSCDNHSTTQTLLREERWEIGEETWSADAQVEEQAKRPNCTLVDRHCIDSGERHINGYPLSRECWKQKLTFACKHPEQKECSVLRAKSCKLIKRKCKEDNPNGCALWEQTFVCATKCPKTTSTLSAEDDLYCLDGQCYDPSYEDNQSFADVVTKLSILNEAKQDLEKSGAGNAKNAVIFNGDELTCTKNIAESLLYDCCFSYSGLATDLKLAKCEAHEENLAMRRERGQCHYVGSYSEKLFDALWKSRDVHAYCCFPSRLTRVVQEAAREQLSIGWGKPEQPLCRGLSIDELGRVDLARVDVSEALESVVGGSSEVNQQKIDEFQVRLENIQENMETRGLCQPN